MRRYAKFVSSDLEAQREALMAYLRTVRTASGATAVQIVHRSWRGARDIEHVGSVHQRVKELDAIVAALRALPVDDQRTSTGEQLISLRDPYLLRKVSAVLMEARSLVTRVTDPGSRHDLVSVHGDRLSATSVTEVADAVAALAIRERDEEVRLATLDPSAEAIEQLRGRQKELTDRKALADSLDAVLHEHDRILDEKALDVAIGSCTTTPITRMSTRYARHSPPSFTGSACMPSTSRW